VWQFQENRRRDGKECLEKTTQNIMVVRYTEVDDEAFQFYATEHKTNGAVLLRLTVTTVMHSVGVA